MTEAKVEHQPDVEDAQIGRMYAEAVWGVAKIRGQQQELNEEFQSLVNDILNKQPAIEEFFQSSTIKQDDRDNIIDRVFNGRASDLLVDFLKVLNRKGRMSLLRAVATAIGHLWEESQGKTAVLVKVACPMADDQRDHLARLLAERLNIKPELKVEIDPNLLGGLWVRVKDTVFDRSVRRNLDQLRQKILTRSFHEIQSGRDIVDRSTGN